MESLAHRPQARLATASPTSGPLVRQSRDAPYAIHPSSNGMSVGPVAGYPIKIMSRTWKFPERRPHYSRSQSELLSQSLYNQPAGSSSSHPHHLHRCHSPNNRNHHYPPHYNPLSLPSPSPSSSPSPLPLLPQSHIVSVKPQAEEEQQSRSCIIPNSSFCYISRHSHRSVRD